MKKFISGAIPIAAILSIMLSTTAGASEKSGVRKIMEIDFSGRPPFKRTVKEVGRPRSFARFEVDRSARKRTRVPGRSLVAERPKTGRLIKARLLSLPAIKNDHALSNLGHQPPPCAEPVITRPAKGAQRLSER